MKLNVKVKFDVNKTNKKIKKKIELCQKVLDSQVLKDSNYFCPMYTGVLMKSAILNTVIGKGRIIWDTPYANEQYYNFPKKSKTHNPNARMKWVDEAKSKHLKDWIKLVNDTYNRNS